VKSGEACTQLYFLINGSVRVITYSDDYGYSVEEQISAPYILQVEGVFGYHQRYTHDFIASSDVNFITIDKEELVRLSEDFLVFRLNLMNNFATQTQKQLRLSWLHQPQSLRERVERFLTQHCVYPAGHKQFNILMTRLADEMNDSRLNVSRVLNQMQKDGVVTLYRGRIEIPQLERLLSVRP
jgi:CRP-like cAMP-binding protein